MAFEGFEAARVDIDDPAGPVSIFARKGGSGPPLLLLHGYPQSHLMWGKVAGALARDFTVVCPDLRGYGGSTKPPSSDDHETSSKRAMARDVYQMGQVLARKKYRFLTWGYRVFIGGLIASIGLLLVQFIAGIAVR